jgi:hypothetical protein
MDSAIAERPAGVQQRAANRGVPGDVQPGWHGRNSGQSHPRVDTGTVAVLPAVASAATSAAVSA